MKPLLPWLLLAIQGVLGCAGSEKPIPLHAGDTITKSAVIAAGEYRLVAPDDPDRAAIHIRGDDITLDFAGVTLVGSGDDDATPDTFRGTAVRIDGGRNITIRNLAARGYKIGLHARNVQSLRIENCDFSYNWRPRLRSTLAREDLVDWLSYHNNENDEWLRYGAGIYLHDCDRTEVRRCTITGNQNALLMTRCDDGQVWGNNFSFNSGVGLGMYRSSRNRVLYNSLDWNVRGYSHGVYHRGQDSAAILVYEQSCENTFVYNSATHSGDGFFLWAGQTTMDTGQGGCNDNVIAFNDFSFAPTNGIEVTFSRNVIIGNRIEECDHGIWGGYSFDTCIVSNEFERNRIGIAIEHGQSNLIADNAFTGDQTGIKLWQNAHQDPNWGYPKHRDTRSRDYHIADNAFRSVARELDIRDTSGVSTVAPTTLPQNFHAALEKAMVECGRFEGSNRGVPRGRQYILVDEWGPYDFKSPKLWPREKLEGGKQRFEILGPPGRWKLISQRGAAEVSAQSGDVPGELIVAPEPGEVVDLNLELEYVGGEVVSPFGAKTPKGAPYRFGYSTFFAPIDWTVKWYAYDQQSDPREHYEAFRKLLDGKPIKQENTSELAYTWFGPIGKDLPADRFATLAEGTVQLPPGRYQIEVTSDDGVRVWVDGERVIDNWTWHVPTTDTATLDGGGVHHIRLEHFEIDGLATIQLRIVKL